LSIPFGLPNTVFTRRPETRQPITFSLKCQYDFLIFFKKIKKTNMDRKSEWEISRKEK
jgi:hypothetical protein